MEEILFKQKFIDVETIELEVGCNVIIKKTLSPKLKDSKSFITIPITIGNLLDERAIRFSSKHKSDIPINASHS